MISGYFAPGFAPRFAKNKKYFRCSRFSKQAEIPKNPSFDPKSGTDKGSSCSIGSKKSNKIKIKLTKQS